MRTVYFYIAVILFIAHQLSDKLDLWHHWWVDGYLDDLLALPLLLPVFLTEQRILWGKQRFTIVETLGFIILFSIVFEWIFPYYSDQFTSDWWDIVAYTVGGLFFYWKMNR